MPDDFDKKARVVGIVLDMFWKSLFSLAVLIFFVLVMRKLLEDPSWELVAAEGFLAGTMFVAFQHYFPKRGEAD